MSQPPIKSWFVGEFFGTFLLVLFGCGAVAQAVTCDGTVGTFQVAIVWGLGLSTAIYLTGSLSGAHLNPAVTIALAAFGRLPRSLIVGYAAAQFAGAFFAAVVLYLLYGDAVAAMESRSDVVRGFAGSEASAMVFTSFFPNPAGEPLFKAAPVVRGLGAFLVELVGTAILTLVIFCVTDQNNRSRPAVLTPLAIGSTLTCLICLFAPLTMAAFNPARDLAPRVFTALVGWKSVAFTANGDGWLTVYVVAPVVGALLGGAIYQLFFAKQYLESALGSDDVNVEATDPKRARRAELRKTERYPSREDGGS